MRAPQPELLVVGQQAGGEILARVIRLLVGLAAHVEDQRLLAVAVLIEELVRVVEKDALGVNLAGGDDPRTALVFSGQGKGCIRLGGGKVEALPRVSQLPFGLEAFFFRLFNDQTLSHCLPEGGRVLKGETASHQRIAPRHPCTRRSARAAVAFVHQHEVVALEGIHGDGLVAHLIAQLVDVDDFDGAARG